MIVKAIFLLVTLCTKEKGFSPQFVVGWNSLLEDESIEGMSVICPRFVWDVQEGGGGGEDSFLDLV